jgi:hypothetical protein
VADDPTAAPLPELPGIDVQAIMQAMAADGVDMSDQAAVYRWLADPTVDLAGMVDEDEFDPDEDVSIKELYGLPDRLPPLRLPPPEELARAARESRTLALARTLADWVGAGRPVDEQGEPGAADCRAAAAALGLEVPADVASLSDIPELTHLWDLAESVELIEIGDHEMVPGAALEAWPDGADEDVLDVWATALAVVMTSLDLDADLHHEAELDFYGAGGAVVMTLFLARSAGVPYPELSELIGEAAGARRGVWDAWVAAHGDPAQVLLTRLEELGAVSYDEEAVRLTPLAQWAMCAQLVDGDVEVPLLPPVEEMTAQDLVAAAEGFTEDELVAETSAWLDRHPPEVAAAELLEVAAAGGPADRMYATSVVTSRIGAAAEPHWRAALDDPRLRAYAKLALDLKPGSEDLAWLLTDVLATTSDVDGPEDIARQLGDAVPAGREQEIFEVMWRIPHPSAGDVLSLLGAHHPDKTIAKAARKAAFKARQP